MTYDDGTEMARFLGMYVLDDDDTPVQATDYLAWARFKAEQGHRLRVDRTHLAEIEVSTVFLAQDHSFGGGALPILYETAVFKRGTFVGIFGRYATRDDAQVGHDQVVAGLLSEHPDRP